MLRPTSCRSKLLLVPGSCVYCVRVRPQRRRADARLHRGDAPRGNRSLLPEESGTLIVILSLFGGDALITERLQSGGASPAVGLVGSNQSSRGERL